MSYNRYNSRYESKDKNYEIKDSSSFQEETFFLRKGIRAFRRFYVKHKFILALALAGIVGVNATSCINSCTNSNGDDNLEKIGLLNDENSDDIEFLNKVGVILDFDYGNVDANRCDFHYLKLDAGNLTDKDKERLGYYSNVGIITSLGNNVYRAVKNIKDVLKVFHVNGPILCNIDDVSEDDYNKIIIFCKALEANGCYVGLSGSNDNLARFKAAMDKVEGYNFSDYIVMVTGLDKDDNLVNADNYFAYEVENEIRERVDLNRYIDDNNYNESSSFQTDMVYTVEPGDCLATIATTYDIDVNDLVSYNGLQLNSVIYPGDQLRIPSWYDKKEVEENDEKTAIDTYTAGGGELNTNIKRVIDISYHNGHLDWDKIAELHKEGKLDGVILRMNDAYNVNTKRLEFFLDPEFEYNLSECNRLDIPYGIYCFSRAINQDKLHEQLYDVCNYIDNNLNQTKNGMDLSFNPRLPVYMDVFEGDAKAQEDLIVPTSGSYNLSLAASLVNEWCKIMTERYGFYTGMYSNKQLIRNSGILPLLDREYVKEIWLAGYGKVDARYPIGEHTLQNNDEWALNDDCSMYQVSEHGYLFSTNEQNVDMNLCDPELFDRVKDYYEGNVLGRVLRRVSN